MFLYVTPSGIRANDKFVEDKKTVKSEDVTSDFTVCEGCRPRYNPRIQTKSAEGGFRLRTLKL